MSLGEFIMKIIKRIINKIKLNINIFYDNRLQKKFRNRGIQMNRYEEIRKYINDLIVDIEKMDYYENKVGCLYSVMDTFAQEYYKYPSFGSKNAFCDFILKFATKDKYNFLELIDPITLIYDISGTPIKLDELDEANIYVPNSSSIRKICNRKEVKNANEKDKKKHKYIELLYKNRSKIIHEGNSAGLIRVKTENNYNTPIYLDYSSRWRLLFPYNFLKELFLDCITNYLIEQEKLGLDPFENNINRKSFYAFYD